MSKQMLIEDSAWALASVLDERLGRALAPAERKLLFDLMYECGHATLTYFASKLPAVGIGPPGDRARN